MDAAVLGVVLKHLDEGQVGPETPDARENAAHIGGGVVSHHGMLIGGQQGGETRGNDLGSRQKHPRGQETKGGGKSL